MSNTPSDAEIIMLAVESGVSVRTGKGAVKLARAVLAKWGTQPQAGAVPQGWKAVPVNPTPEMWKAAKSVPASNPPCLVWDAMLAATPTPTPTPTPTAEQPALAPLSDEQIERDRPMMVEPAAYAAGIRYAEKHHGIKVGQPRPASKEQPHDT